MILLRRIFLNFNIQKDIPGRLRNILTCLLILFLAGNVCTGQDRLKYYGVDDIGTSQFGFLRDSLGGNYALVELSTDSGSWKSTLAAAEKNHLKLIIWPLGSGHQWTCWAWDGASWDISKGLNILRFSENYINSGGQALLAIVMSHEPFYNNGSDPFTSAELKMLYSDIKTVAPHVKLFVYMNDMAYYDKRVGTKIEDGIMDIAGTYRHTFGGAEGSWEDSFKQIDDDRALIDSKGLNMQLFFSLQTFGISGTKYQMPTAAEMLEFGTTILEKDKLDGISFYPWDRVASDYTSWLSKDRYDLQDQDRWGIMKQLSVFLPANTGTNPYEKAYSRLSLSQNYPNPIEQNTTIEFNVSEPGLHTLKVFNLLGQPVLTIFDDKISIGNHSVNFNAGQLPPGVYFYSLRNKNNTVTKKMTVK